MSGPPPKKNARRRNIRPDWVTLPEGGRKGRTPAWPLEGRAPKGWADLWKSPQAVMWEKVKVHVQVATYLMTRNSAHELLFAGKPNATLLAEVRQMEDRLGLSSMAMKHLQWEIGTDNDVERHPAQGTVIEANDRFRRL